MRGVFALAFLLVVYFGAILAGKQGGYHTFESGCCSREAAREVHATLKLWRSHLFHSDANAAVMKEVFECTIRKDPRGKQLYGDYGLEAFEGTKFKRFAWNVYINMEWAMALKAEGDTATLDVFLKNNAEHAIGPFGADIRLVHTLPECYTEVFDHVTSCVNPEAWIACHSEIYESLAQYYDEYLASDRLEGPFHRAVCDMSGESGVPGQKVEGKVYFRQKVGGGPMAMKIQLHGLDTADAQWLHGFHIHEHGAVGNQCKDAGGHYNPDGKDHGGPSDANRHVGDLGNVIEKYGGTVKAIILHRHVSLTGDHSVMGRAVVVHAMQDDLGQGGFPDSKTKGHAGARLGCCVITETQDEQWG